MKKWYAENQFKAKLIAFCVALILAVVTIIMLVIRDEKAARKKEFEAAQTRFLQALIDEQLRKTEAEKEKPRAYSVEEFDRIKTELPKVDKMDLQ